MEKEYMTTQEVVEAFRVSRVTLLKMIHEGKIRAFKVGNSYRFKKEQLEEDFQVKK
ncbi:MAG: Helix-turn-helix domain [Candidatus Poribacteria bacterium]|nr:Helix-turn-helix domain [Euryarchaeota archaeon]MDQ1329724.1 Helix-turn-helix domain [Candidatus Poribacteria bacterium]